MQDRAIRLHSRDVQQRVTDQQQHENVREQEKMASMVVGGGLLFFGLTRRSGIMGLASLVAGGALLYRGWTGHCSVYEKMGVDTHDSSGFGVGAKEGRRVKWSVHVNRDSRDLYDFWRNLENLSSIMRHLESVTQLDDKRSRWVAKAPLGRTLTWDAEIINDKPGELIAWQSLPDSQVNTAGSVHFQRPAAGDGTNILISLKYDPPGGSIAANIAKFLGQGLEQTIEEDLRIFKQVMETGEVATAARHQ